jgi:hypothetical protein
MRNCTALSSDNFLPIPPNRLIPNAIEFPPQVRELPLKFAILKVEPKVEANVGLSPITLVFSNFYREI